jgi:hypothetical protein
MADTPETVDFLTIPLANGGTWTYLDRLTDGRIMCCLCFAYCTLDQLSRDPKDGQLTDVCQECRGAELANDLTAPAEGSTP